uniref:uncharacterized protein LOC120337160 n=1 Tax=Styela clava TaxID=7725 RepID=UPI00193A0BC7|nr:uncharacterized protein LOC120337160 [Styela clava]
MKELIKQHVGFHQDENFVPTKCLKRVCISNMPYDRIARFSIKTLLYNTILWIILIAIIPLDHRGMIYQFCGNKIPLVGATMSTTMTCTGSTSFVNEIAKSSFVSARNSPSPVKFKFLRRSYVPYLPLKVIITTDNGPNITSFFLQAHEQGKTTPIGNFNSTFSDKDISIIGCGVNTAKFKNTATTETGKYRKRSKVTLYWNPPANFKTAIQFRVNVFTTDRPTRGWRGLTSEEIVPRVAECYTGNGASYRGTMSHTKSGIYCQKWDSQTPHTHIFSRNRRQFADKGLESDFCRKPDTDNIPWCYTTAQRPVFEACDIPKCTNGGLPKHFAEFGETVGDKKVSRKFGEIGRIKFSANFSMVKANYTNAAVFENGVIVLGKDEDSIKNIKLAKNKGLTFTSNTESKSGSTAVIAPFWTEIHRNQSIGSNYVFFRESTEPDVMIPLGDDVTSKLRFLNRKKPRDEMFVPKWALIVTWYLVGGNSSVTDVKNLNSFQAILTTDGNRSFVLLNYDMRKWSEKKNTALIGYKSGNAMSFLNHSLPYTNKLQFETASRLGRAVTTQSNVGKAGQMMYEISICNKLLPDGSKPKKCSDSLTLRLKAAPSPPTNCQGKNCTGNRTCDSKTGDCVCPAGYTGSQCEINIDDCQQNPCQNGGTCTDATNGYYCTCRPGYTGSRCEANVNECFKSPCLNNGTCVDGENSYRCICTPEYKGVNCETLKDQCKSNPCMNGAKCTTTEDNFVCNCAEEFSGEQCQYRYCFDGSCIRSHTCQDRTTGKENCTCRAEAPSNGYCQEVPSLPACSSEKTGTDPSGYILWPTTNSGSVAVSSCPTPTSKTATRVCNSSNWGAPDTSACTQLSPRSRELQDLDRTTIVAGNAATLANQILNVTSNEKDSLVAYDLQLVSNILLKVVNVIGEENNYDITSDVINSVSNVIEAPSEELRVASQEFSSNSRLVQVIDNVLLKLEVLTDQNVYLNSKNVKVAVAGISGNETFTGKSFTLSSNLQPGISDGTDSGGNSGQASVFIPPSVTEKVTSTSFTRIQFAVYTSTALFNHVRVDDGTVPDLGSNMNVSVYSDHVVSASIGNTKITGLSENVTITISRSNSYYGKGPHCVFYNFPNNGGEGSWSAEGCHLNPESTLTTTICDCNHLTNFAVIMDVYGTVEYFNEYQNMILQILTYIGCSLSIFGLLCTLISYLMFEKLRKEVPAKILICLCAALITVNIVYLCLQSAYYSSHTTCVAIAAIMHYALLSSLMWMGLEAINMYIALVKVFNTYYRKYMLKMSLAGWGVPLLIVLIAFIVQFATGIPSYEMNSKTEICWLRRDVFYGTLVAPFAIVFLLNSVIYCLVLAQLLGMSSRKLKHLDSARKLKKPAKRENFRKLRGAIGLMALLGISWGFALGTFDKAALTFAYVFVVFNSSQGFWVFIFHCVLKKEVSKCWKKLIFNKGTFRDGSSRWSRFSSSNTRGSRSTTTSSARSMSASSIRTSYLVPKPSKSVDRSEASIGMDSKGLDVVTRTNSTANPVFDDPDIGPPPPFPPPPIPTEEQIVRRVPRRTSPQPSTTISTQTDINLLHSSDTDSQNSMESMENSRQDEQNMEDEERRDSVNNNSGLPGIQGFQFPDHREVVISPSNESGIYSDASVSSTAILVEMPTYMDLESNNNEVSALRNNDVSGHHSGEINLGYEDDTLDDVTIISNDVTLINSGANDNVDIVERHGGVNSRPHQRYAVKETKPDSTPGMPRIKGTNSLTDDARNTDSGISISSDATGAGSSTAGSTRSERPELVTQDSRSSLYSVNSNTSSASGPSSGSESSYQIGRVRDRQSSGDLPSPHLWKAPLVIKRSDDHTKANKKEGIFRRKPVITGPNDNSSTKRALWKRSRNNSKDNSAEKQSMTSFPPKRKLKRQPNKSENCDKSEGATNKLDIQMTNFSLNRGSFHDGAL